MIPFKKIKFRELIEPKFKVKLKRGHGYPFVPMENVESGMKYPQKIDSKTFKGGGSRFADDDILFARITPCLQNKKIVKVKNLDGGTGFGSTEFFVFRAKKERTNPDFLYYVTKLDDLRDKAIQSMVGASGRQRADINSIYDHYVFAPDLPIQTEIASRISTYDDLIENNYERIKVLEEFSQLLYTEWFVKFNFPGCKNVKIVDSGTKYGKVPDGWDVKRLDSEIKLLYGKALKEDDRMTGDILVCGSGGVIGCHNAKMVDGPGIVVGRKGNAGAVTWIHQDFWVIDTAYFVKTKLNLEFVFYLLKSQNFVLGDVAVPGLNREQAYQNQILIPPNDLITLFKQKVEPILKLIGKIKNENSNLLRIRDLLIPQLVTGRKELK